MRAPFGTARVILSLAICLVWTAQCRAAPEEAVIGVAMGGLGQAGAVAQMVLDSLHGGRRPRIVVQVGALTSTPGPGGLPGSVREAEYFVRQPNVLAVVGHPGSRDALLAAPIYNRAGIAQIVPTGTSRRLRSVGAWTFMLAPDDSTEGTAIGDFAAERLHARRVAIFYVADEYGSGLRDGVEIALRARGIPVVARAALEDVGECPPVRPANAFTDQVAVALRNSRPDVIVVAGRGNHTGCVAQAARALVPSARYVAGDGTLPESMTRRRAGAATDSVYLMAFWHPERSDSAGHAFVERFRHLVGRDPHHGDAMVYDAVMAAGLAIIAVGPDRTRVRDWLASLGRDRPAPRGVTGPLSLGAPRPATLVPIRLADGRPVSP